MSLDPTLKSVLETLEDIGKQLEARNDEPSTAKAPGDDVTSDMLSKRVMTPADQFEIRSKLKNKSNAELATMFSIQARKSEAGIPFDTWANAGGYAVQSALGGNPDDSVSA
jgi:hypothetical protein